MMWIDFIMGKWYDILVYMFWIGDCIWYFDEVYVEFLRGVENLIGIKCGFLFDFDELIWLIDVFSFQNELGCFMFIMCFGIDKVVDYFLGLICKVKLEGRVVVWLCDLMYGNMFKVGLGYKIWLFDCILSEV